MEGFRVISGNGKDELSKQLQSITNIATERYSTIKIAHHEWIDAIDNIVYKQAIDDIRISNAILSKIRSEFPGTTIVNVTEADEVYWAVSPKDAVGSDRSLVDCHYDSPFAWFPTGGVIFYRVIIAVNENEDVSTYFPDEKIRVKMSTGDFHGLDYNRDLHCVEGKIPEGKVRILLKLHYLITPPDKDGWNIYVRWINVKWTQLSRETMRMSAKPENPFEWFIGFIVNICRIVFNKIYYIIVVIVALFIVYRYLPKKYSLRALWRRLFR